MLDSLFLKESKGDIVGKMIRVVFYIRVSTEEQKLHGLSLEAQRMKLDEYAKDHKLKVVGIYADEGVSGRKPIKKRPQLQIMLNDAQKGMFDLIIFIKLDRYFRSVAEYHECQKILEANNVSWKTTEEKYDLTTANGRAFVNMKLTIAELEADQTGERIKLVNEYKVKEGYALSGAVPFGWCLKRENGHSRVIRDPDNEHIIYEMLDYYEKHKNYRKTYNFICDKYDLSFTYKVLRNTISSTFLYGFYRDNPNYCEAYCDKSRYDHIQSLLNENIKEIKTRRIYLFSNLVTCSSCGCRMTGNYTIPNKNTGKEFLAYRCNSRSNRVKCNKRLFIGEIKLEQYLLNHLVEGIEKYIVSASVVEKKVKKKKRADEKKIIQAEIDRLNKMFQKNRISEEKYDREYEELELKLNELDKEYVEKDNTSNLEALQQLINTDLLSVYDKLDRENKRAFWQKLIKNIIIYEDGTIDFSIREQFLK